MSRFLLSSFVPNGFSLSIVSFLSIEKQMMLRMERATHHKSLINWAMEVFGKENLRVQMCIIRDFLVRVAFFENLCLAHLSYKCDQKRSQSVSKLPKVD